MTDRNLTQIFEANKARPNAAAATDEHLDHVIDTLNANGFKANWRQEGSSVKIDLSRDGVSAQFSLLREMFCFSHGFGNSLMDAILLRRPANHEELNLDGSSINTFWLETDKDEVKLAEFLVGNLGRMASAQKKPSIKGRTCP